MYFLKSLICPHIFIWIDTYLRGLACLSTLQLRLLIYSNITSGDFIEGIGAGACEGAPALLLLGGQMASTGEHDVV